MSSDDPRPDLRASDADREAASERLRIAAVEGRLDPDELDERISAAFAARFCSELAELTADVTLRLALPPLPAGRPVFVRPAPASTGSPRLRWSACCRCIGSVLAIVCGHVALRQIAR